MNQYGTPSELANALDDHNAWRRGAGRPAPDPVALGRIIEAAAHTLRDLEREVTHWKANHATEVRRARILKERTDMPMERVAAYEQWGSDTAELRGLRQHAIDNAEIEGISFSHVGGNKYLALCRDGYQKCGIAMQRIAPDGSVSRAWVGSHGMILWPRTECEAGVERAEMALLRLENEKLRKQLDDDADVCSVCDKGSMRPVPRFPVELRKMWSGSEVQQWLDEQFSK